MLTTASILIVVFFSAIVSSQLEAQRLGNAKIWIERSLSAQLTQAAYGPSVVNFTTIFHRVDYAGNFGPGILALEYDLIVNGLSLLIGYNPVQLRPTWDAVSTRWISTDILRVDYTLGISTAFDEVSRVYMLNQEDFRFTEYIVFDANSALINTGFTVQDTGANTLFTLTAANVPVEVICAGFIFPACGQIYPLTNRSYINDTGFASITDCIVSLSTVAAIPQPCPYPQRSDTLACRSLHALSSFFLPQVHCSHVAKVSPVCRAQCLPVCAQCHPNATCEATFPNFPNTPQSLSPVYVCRCNNGFAGNGTSCEPVRCNANGRCPSTPGTSECSNATGNLCLCKSSFVHQPDVPLAQRDLCGCPELSTARMIDDQLVCIPLGRCIDDDNRRVCPQRYNQVKCRPVNNTFNPFAACRCNYGFQGGWEYPCSCPVGKRIRWSSAFDGQVCLAPNECTVDGPDCREPQVCKIEAGKSVGVCAAPARKRFYA